MPQCPSHCFLPTKSQKKCHRRNIVCQLEGRGHLEKNQSGGSSPSKFTQPSPALSFPPHRAVNEVPSRVVSACPQAPSSGSWQQCSSQQVGGSSSGSFDWGSHAAWKMSRFSRKSLQQEEKQCSSGNTARGPSRRAAGGLRNRGLDPCSAKTDAERSEGSPRG